MLINGSSERLVSVAWSRSQWRFERDRLVNQLAQGRSEATLEGIRRHGISSVSVSAGRLFTLGNTDGKDTVFGFDAATGKELWKHSYECPLDAKYYEGGPGSTPTVDGDHVFTLSKRGHLFCFDAASGKIIWQKNLLEELGVKKPEWGFAGSPLVQGDLLILNLGEAGTAVDKRSGKVVWSSGKDISVTLRQYQSSRVERTPSSFSPAKHS